MKKSLAFPFVLILFSFGLASCVINTPFDSDVDNSTPDSVNSTPNSTSSETPHEHTFSSQYSYDENYHFHVCEECGEVDKKESHIGGEESCLGQAICEVCNAGYGSVGTHYFGSKIDEVEATCTTNGVAEHLKCQTCEKLFIEENETLKEVSYEQLSIPASHNYGELIVGSASSCEENGILSHYKCLSCNTYFNEEKIETTLQDLTVNSSGHSYGSLINKKDATCKESGMEEHYHCSICNTYFDTNKKVTSIESLTISTLNHQEVIDEAKEPSCTQTGLTEGSHCELCGDIIIEQEIIPIKHNLTNYGCLDCDYVIPYTLSIDSGLYGTTTTNLTKDYVTYEQEVELTFNPNDGYVVVYYTVTDDSGSKTISAFNHTSATIKVLSNTTIFVKYDKESNYVVFNYSNGTSRAYYYVDGGYENSSGKSYTYDDVISSIKDDAGNAIDSSVFSVLPITTFTDGKWANLYYSTNSYGLSLYSSETEYSGITFDSNNYIYSITITYYDNKYPSRALIESNGKILTGIQESETVYSYIVNGYDFSITNISGGNYLYIPSIEIVYSSNNSLPTPYTITFDANGGEGTMADQIIETTNFALNENKFSKDGYRFIGWSLSKDSTSIEYGDGETIDKITSNITLYAVYEVDPSQIANMAVKYTNQLSGDLSNVYAYYGGQDEHDITNYIEDFSSDFKGILELQFGKIVYVGNDSTVYQLCASNFIGVSQSYENASAITLLDAYFELAYAYYYQGTQLQYDQGSSYQRKIRTMAPEDATELYQKYLDCSTFVSNAFYNAFGEVVVSSSNIDSVTTKVLINYARDNIATSNEVVLYQDNLSSMTDSEKEEAMTAFKNALQPGDLYVYRHTSDTAGHVMLYVGNGYFLHSTGSSYNYTSLVDKTENFTSVQGSINPEGSVRYQSTASTVYKSTSTRYLFYVDPDGVDSNDRYAILRPLNRSGLTITPTTIARCMASGLDIEKSANNATSVTLGEELTYTIKIKNYSDKTINNISITDTVPTNTSFVSMEQSYNYNQKDGNIIWNIPSISANQTISLDYTVKVDENTSSIGKMITSSGSVGHISLNTLNIQISSLSDSQLSDFVTMALQYYNNSNVSYSSTANNSTSDPTSNIVTFSNGANFVTTLYKRYYASLGKTLDISSDLTEVTNDNFMDSIITSSGLQTDSKLYKMLVNGGYGGTYFTKDYYMDRMRTVEYDYLLPGDIISFKNSSAPYNQYLYLGNVTIEGTTYLNVFLLFTSSAGVKMVYGSDADALLAKFIGYNSFAVIRPSLYM